MGSISAKIMLGVIENPELKNIDIRNITIMT